MNRAWCGAELMLCHSLSTVNTIMSVPGGFKFKNQYGFDMSTDIMPDPVFGEILVPISPLFLPSMLMDSTRAQASCPAPHPALLRSILVIYFCEWAWARDIFWPINDTS